MIWGDSLGPQLDRSIASLRRFHPDLPVHVERVQGVTDPFAGLLSKSRMAKISPFSTTLFLDADTIVLGNLNYGFERAERHGLACCICECPWARRHTGLRDHGDLVEYNTGVLFFAEKSRPIFDAWERLAPVLDSSTDYVTERGELGRQTHDDQAAFAAAVRETEQVPFVLPINWNFRPQFYRCFYGPLMIWHHRADPPKAVFDFAEYYRRTDAIIQFHH